MLKRELDFNHIFLIVVIGSILPSPGFLSLSGRYLIQVIYFIFVTLFLFHRNGFSLRLHYWRLIALSVIPFFIALTLNLTTISNAQDVFRELIKFIFFPILFFILWERGRNSSVKLPERQIERFVVFCLFIQSVFVILQFFDFSRGLLNIFYGVEKLSANTDFTKRVRYMGSFENPNYLGFFVCSLLCFYLSIVSRKSNSFIIILALSVMLILLSGSRTSLLAAMALFLLYFRRLAPLIFLLIMVFFGSYLYELILSIKRLAVFSSWDALINSHSFSERIKLLESFAFFWKEKFIFGHFQSPLKVVDNFIALQMLRYGLFYWLSIVLIFYCIKPPVKVIIYFSVFFLIFSLTGAFFDNFRLLLIFLCLFVIASTQSQKEIGPLT